MTGAYKALIKLRDEKVIKAIGVGVNESDMCVRFANAGDFDCMVLAGRYSLLDHKSALDDLFPIAKKNNIGIILAGVFNSGILAKGTGENVTYNYDKIPHNIKIKSNKILKICDNNPDLKNINLFRQSEFLENQAKNRKIKIKDKFSV